MTAVLTPDSFTSAVTSLRASQKTPRGVPAYTLWVNRPLGRLAAALFYRLRVSANAVTVLGAVLSLGACVLIATVDSVAVVAVVATVALALGYVLDSADGQLARLTGTGSRRGEWLDHTLDALRTVALHTSVLVGLYRFGDLAAGWLLVPLAYLLVSVTSFSAGVLVDKLLRQGVPVVASTPAAGSRVRPYLMLPVDYGVLCLAFALWAVPGAFVAVYTVLMAAAALIGAALLAHWWRQLGRPVDIAQGA